MPGVRVPGLVRLRRRHILSPLSNANVSLLVDMARAQGLPWDLILCAEVFQRYKPDPRTYLGSCEFLALDPAQVMLCAAHNADLAAAQRLGLRTGFVARPAEYGPHQARDFGPEGEWDIVASDMQDFAGKMAA